MQDYKYRLGLYLGRFQPLHIGHASVIDRMLKECEEIVIAIGSAQEFGTERNPLDYGKRRYLIEMRYFGQLNRIHICPIYDRQKYSEDSSWGVYLLGQLESEYELTPDVIYEGDDSVNTHWYDDCYIPVVRVSRDETHVSGTELRKCIKEDRKNLALSYMPIEIHIFYDELRKEIQNGKTH